MRPKLTRVGETMSGILYKDENEKYYVDTDWLDDPTEVYMLSPAKDPDGEPCWPVSDFEIVNPLSEREKKEKQFRSKYIMLSRMQSDCRGFLSPRDCRYQNEKSLWGETVAQHIASMKKLWNEIPDDIKPEWLSWNDILRYEKEMSA